MKKKTKRILLIFGILALAMTIAVVIFLVRMQDGLDQLENTRFEELDLSSIPDGVYEGYYVVFPITVLVEVTVEAHVIRGIELKQHVHGQGSEAEVIPDRVLDAQSLQVDIVSGATYSSYVILHAIEDALTMNADS